MANIEYKGYGFHAPIADNTNEEGRIKNRRVEVKIITDMVEQTLLNKE